MTTSLVLFEDGKLRYEPVEAIGRLPTFMMKQSAKMLDARPASSNPKVAAAPSATKPRSDAVEPAEKKFANRDRAQVFLCESGRCFCSAQAPGRKDDRNTRGQPS